MSELPQQVAQAALDLFTGLPSKCKPRTHPDGRREWTPLSALVISRHRSGEQVLECVSLATGTKCLPSTALSRCEGAVLHDSHAEILALRGFNRWLLQELAYQLDHPKYSSPYVQLREGVGHDTLQPAFCLKDDLAFHFFTTEAPCGDASMELLINSKAPEDAVPWNCGSKTDHIPGRGDFSLLGAVRRKPARADAEASLSKSCSDKLTLKQMTTLLSFPADMFFAPSTSAFIRNLIVPWSQYDETSYTRAFGQNGRLKNIPAHATFFNMEVLPQNFALFEYANARGTSSAPKASNISTVWVKGPGQGSADTLEILLNGVKQGYKQFDADVRKQSCLCRRQMLLLAQSIACKLKTSTLATELTYQRAKSSPIRGSARERRQEAKGCLGIWPVNMGDDEWYT